MKNSDPNRDISDHAILIVVVLFVYLAFRLLKLIWRRQFASIYMGMLTKLKFGQMLRRQRRSLKMTQYHLRDLTDISARTIRDIEAGKTNPTFDTIQVLLKAVGLGLMLGEIPEKTTDDDDDDQLLPIY